MTAFKVMEDIAEARFRWIQNVRDKFLACRDVEMARDYEIPIEDWEALRDALMQPFDHRVKIDGIKAISAGSSNGIIYKLAELAGPHGFQLTREKLQKIETEYKAVVAENERLREALADVKWRIDDITAMVIQRTDDEFSVPVLNLKSAGRAIDAALAHSKEVGNG